MEEGSLSYDLSLAYFRHPNERQILPRVHLSVELSPGQPNLLTVYALLDTGADASVFDGSVAVEAGWTRNDIVERAIRVIPFHGLAPGRAVPAYLHEVTGYFGGFTRCAELKLRVLITMPNLLAFSVLGRSDFFEQVDVTFAERDRKLYFRFRDASALQSYV